MAPSHTVLIVDDEIAVAQGLVIRLHAAGYATLVSLDGELGLKAAYQEKPDAIILDARLPDMDGIEFMQCLRNSPITQRIPVIMLSGDHQRRDAALEGGACEFLLKPYSRETMLAAVRNAVNSSCAVSK